MNQAFSELFTIFNRTKEDIEMFNSMLQPVVDHAKDEHERLYFHHILEEEEQRLERLGVLLPMLKLSLDEDLSHRQLVQVLQELNLEKFGLHNFREHLDLAMFEFKDEERQELLKTTRERTQADYLRVKELMTELNNRIEDVSPVQVFTDLAVGSGSAPSERKQGKKLTVGSLKMK
ncbi:IMEF encapsulin system ferritin-like cargo protein [Ammoniphilus sp. YIM 78166]|uniref:IMEF encapsulin system ferritin-like cargo protein n=1 Tax=Ammoniphilus sp. YIM 78166 TaxID=1644106 RepID=UPI00106FC30C|nr:IMEF encapsulin system ferritin-like cargo protein [Ammoniphilus sp. YIM 78166]